MKSMISPIAISLSCLAYATLASAAAEPDAVHTNPALSYWQAAALLPPLDDARARQLRDVADGKIEFRPEVLDGLDFSGSANFLRKAAASAAECQWSLAWQDGPAMTVPHLAKMRELSTICLLLAEEKFAADDTGAGIEMLLVAHRMARDTGAGDFLIGHLSQNMLERKAMGVAARHCMGWTAAERSGYAERLGVLPERHPLHRAVERELLWIDWYERQLEDNPEAANQLLGANAKGALPKTPESAADMVAGYRQLHGEALEALKLAGEARRTAVAKVQETILASKNLLVGILMPDLISLVRNEDRVAVSQAMLELALARGPEIAETDVKGTPFTLARKDGALEVHSAEPEFSLRFGR